MDHEARLNLANIETCIFTEELMGRIGISSSRALTVSPFFLLQEG